MFMLAPSAPVAIVIPVPAMIVLEAPALAFPIPREEPRAVMMRPNPDGALVRRTSPIPFVPVVAPFHRIPVALHPNEIRSRCGRLHHNHAWSRWRADIHSDRNVRRH